MKFATKPQLVRRFRLGCDVAGQQVRRELDRLEVAASAELTGDQPMVIGVPLTLLFSAGSRIRGER